MAENSITMLQITDHPPHPNLIRCWNLMKGDQSTGIIDFWWMERFIFQKRQRKTKANSFVRLTMESTSRLANWLHWKSMVNIECLFFYSFYIFFLHLCIIGEREKKRLLTSPNITATAADAGNGNEIWIHFGDFFSKNNIGFFFEKVLPFLKFGLFHFWEEAFFYKKKKKYGIFLKLGHFNLIKTILQFSRRHVVVKLDALHIYFIVLLKSLAFHRSTLWKRENYILHFSQYVCIHFFALLLQIEESKSGNFVTLKNASSLVFPTVNSAIIEFQKKEEKKIGKAKCIFLHHPKKSAIVEFKLPF